ncbi:hypothetical protein L204_106299 [Cryptococcus depauperatus]|nr:hypothetical protein L204_05866 [Cryptococcus depauperatus CBS 7855]
MDHYYSLVRRLDYERRDECVSCDAATPACNCTATEKCILTSRTCNQCPAIQCIKNPSSLSSGGVNAGMIAGPVVAVLVIASLGLFWWLRRKKRRDMKRVEDLTQRMRKAESAGMQLSPAQSPAPGSAHSRSPNRNDLPLPPPSATSRHSPLPPAPVNAEYYDENGATIRVYAKNGAINADPKADPFSDRQSVSTMGSSGTANIIPIQWIPPSRSDDGISRMTGSARQSARQSAAAKLDEARQNLFKPKPTPSRPARSPGLDLCLNASNTYSTVDSDGLRSPVSWNDRASYLSDNSSAPSYFSGTSDFQLDAPKILTSKQVQYGRLQQAEMLQIGNNHQKVETARTMLSPVKDEEDSFDKHAARQSSVYEISPIDPSFHSGRSSDARTLTPTTRKLGAEELIAEGEGSSGDLRFSMGSLAYRDSVSTMATNRYLASAITVPAGHPSLSTPVTATMLGTANDQTRESVMSSKSFADSVLGAFPMIPPDQNRPPLPANASAIARGENVPHSTSVDTLDKVVSRPPPTYRPPPPGPRPPSSVRGSTTPHYGGEDRERTEGGKKRPETQTSVADSFLGSFPFVPPNLDDLAGLPSPKN